MVLPEHDAINRPRVYVPDTANHVDTSLNHVDIDGAVFNIKVLRDQNIVPGKKDSPAEYYPLTITISDSAGSQVFTGNYYENVYNIFKNGRTLDQPGLLCMNLISYGWGSGWGCALYELTFRNRKIRVDSILGFGEVSYVIFNEDESRVLLFDGIWGDGESHFADHRYKAFLYTRTEKGFRSSYLGTTKYKYVSPEDTVFDIVSAVKTREPDLLQKVNARSFIYPVQNFDFTWIK